MSRIVEHLRMAALVGQWNIFGWLLLLDSGTSLDGRSCWTVEHLWMVALVVGLWLEEKLCHAKCTSSIRIMPKAAKSVPLCLIAMHNRKYQGGLAHKKQILLLPRHCLSCLDRVVQLMRPGVGQNVSCTRYTTQIVLVPPSLNYTTNLISISWNIIIS